MAVCSMSMTSHSNPALAITSVMGLNPHESQEPMVSFLSASAFFKFDITPIIPLSVPRWWDKNSFRSGDKLRFNVLTKQKPEKNWVHSK
jgi:hypothetical protein